MKKGGRNRAALVRSGLRVALAAGLCASPARAQVEPLKPAIVATCSPGAVQIGSEPLQRVPNPIAFALQRSGPGSMIQVQPGDYPSFAVGFDKQSPWNARTSGGTAGQPVVVRGLGGVRIRRSGNDTIAISQGVRNGHITFENLEIEPGDRAGIMFYKCGPNQMHEGYRFYDCDILGAWDHRTASGVTSKWGVWGHSLKDFEFKGRTRPARIENLRHEHGFYLQNPRGDMTIENVAAARLGRTFCQFTARANEGPEGVGTITVRNCRVTDCCIAAGDNYKGGSAFTVAGRITGTVVFERNVYRSGFDHEIARLTRPESPFGTGALVCWDAGGAPNGTLVLRDNDFELAPSCGDRSLVSIGGCRSLRIEGKNRFVSGGGVAALELDPMNGEHTQNSPIGEVRIAPSTVIEGEVRSRGKTLDEKALAALAGAAGKSR